MYEYSAKIVSVTDGDTLVLDIDLGFSVTHRRPCRLLGINAPEKDTTEGVASKAYLAELLQPGATIVVRTKKDKSEKYGRTLANVLIGDESASDLMVKAGHAVYWDGKGARPSA